MKCSGATIKSHYSHLPVHLPEHVAQLALKRLLHTSPIPNTPLDRAGLQAFTSLQNTHLASEAATQLSQSLNELQELARVCEKTMHNQEDTIDRFIIQTTK